MTMCDFCNKEIPASRIDSVKRKGGRVKYCSNRCNKLSWAKRHNEIRNSFENGNRAEWLKTGTGKGWSWEQWVALKYGGVWQGFSKPFDVLIGDQAVDVKVCELYKRPNKRGKAVSDRNKQTGWWVFNKNAGNVADTIFCIGLINGVPRKMWKISLEKFGKSVTISPNSTRLDKYVV